MSFFFPHWENVLVAALMTSLVPKPRTPLTKDVLTACYEQKDMSGFLKVEVIRGI